MYNVWKLKHEYLQIAAIHAPETQNSRAFMNTFKI